MNGWNAFKNKELYWTWYLRTKFEWASDCNEYVVTRWSLSLKKWISSPFKDRACKLARALIHKMMVVEILNSAPEFLVFIPTAGKEILMMNLRDVYCHNLLIFHPRMFRDKMENLLKISHVWNKRESAQVDDAHKAQTTFGFFLRPLKFLEL